MKRLVTYKPLMRTSDTVGNKVEPFFTGIVHVLNEEGTILSTGKGKIIREAEMDAIPFFDMYFGDHYEFKKMRIKATGGKGRSAARFLAVYGHNKIRTSRLNHERIHGIDFGSDYKYIEYLFNKYFSHESKKAKV